MLRLNEAHRVLLCRSFSILVPHDAETALFLLKGPRLSAIQPNNQPPTFTNDQI